MVFSSIEFLFYFLPIFFVCYFAFRRSNLVILLFSLIFYAWGGLDYLPLLVVYIVVNYGFGLAIDRQRRWAKPLLAVGVGIDVAILVTFKYLGFLLTQGNALLGFLHAGAVPAVSLALPLGISFFTFQGISYLIDVYRGDVAAQPSLIKFATYKALFPQLIAGPIVRYRQVANRIDHRDPSIHRIRYGIIVFLVGLSQKVLIANTVAGPADRIFGLPAADLTPAVAWVGTLCYAVQILFDFGGYSNMAIGLGHMMGFSFPRNFNRPYISQSMTEFWRRWHITLSTWFRDYLYIPLGGSRHGALRTYSNLIIVFFLCGLWHGASWTFALWGLYNGFFLVIERLGFGVLLGRIFRPLRHLYLLLAVCFGWVLFRADSLPHAGAIAGAMIGFAEGDPIYSPVQEFVTPTVFAALIIAAIVCFVPPVSRRQVRETAAAWFGSRQFDELGAGVAVSVVVLSLGVLSALSLASGTYNPFIYFRF